MTRTPLPPALLRAAALFAAAWLAAAPGALAGGGGPGPGPGPFPGGQGPGGQIRESWGWLRASTAAPDDVKVAPGLTAEEEAVGRAALPATVALAITRAGDVPAEGAESNGSGFLVSADGLLATNWHILSALKGPGGGSAWLWARLSASARPDPRSQGWLRAIPLGATWWGDVGLARLVTTRRDLPRVAFAEPFAPGDRKPLGRRYVAVGAPMGRRNVISAGSLAATTWFDAAGAGGRCECRRSGKQGSPSKAAVLIGMHFADTLSMNGGSGSGVFDLDGRCVGIVSAGDPSRPLPELAFVRPSDWIRPLIDRIALDATWNPPDLGLRFGPEPAPPGMPVQLPDSIAAARAKKQRGGAVVTGVAFAGPARGAIWEGDVVLEIGGKPVFGDVYESFAPAILALTPEVPTDVVVWRGGKRQTLQIVPRLGRDLYEDFAAEHDARAGMLRMR